MSRIPVPPTWVAPIVAALIIMTLILIGNQINRAEDWRFTSDTPATQIEETR